MITYVNSSFGVRILLRFHGSALWKSLLPALISTIIYFGIFFLFPGGENGLGLLFLHPYPMQAVVTAFTFLLVFRANYSYNRWWEAYTAVYLMHSKWLDLATEIAAFHYQSTRYDDFKPPSFGANPGVQSLAHRASDISEFNYSSNTASFAYPAYSFTSSTVDRRDGYTESPERVGPESVSTSPRTQPKQSHPNTGLARHARGQTMTDLIQQMDACEAEEEERRRQSLVSDELDGSGDKSNDGDIDGNKTEVETQADPNGAVVQDVEEGGRKRSWLQKMKDRHSESQLLRKSKKLEKQRRRSDINRASSATNLSGVSKKMRRRRTRHAVSKDQPATDQPATERLYYERKSISRHKESAQRERQQLQFCDRFDVKTGKPYSLFTAVSRKHLREGHLDPDGIPPLLFLEEVAHLLSLMSAVAFSTLRNDLPEAESPLTVFEPGLPWPLVDPDQYKGKVRKGWTQSKSKMYASLQFILGRSRNDHARTLYNAARPFRVIGNVSDAEIEKLQEARGPLAKVSLVSMWILELVSREYQAGSTGAVAPPIISRIYQFISEGLAGYNQARKIAYIPFPFPHAQITTLFMLVIDFFVTPLLMATFVTNPILGFTLNFASVMCFTGLHEVAREIDNPFQNVPNDVPLNNYQAQFNEGLMVMFYGYHPDAYWKKDTTKTSYASSKSGDGVNDGREGEEEVYSFGSDQRNQQQEGKGNTVTFGSSNRESISTKDLERERKQEKNKKFQVPLGESIRDERSMIGLTNQGMQHQSDTGVAARFPTPQSDDSSSKKPNLEPMIEGQYDSPIKILEKTHDTEPCANTTNKSGTNTDDFFRLALDVGARQNSTSSSMDSFRILHSQSDSFRTTGADSFREIETDGPRYQDSILFRIPKRSGDASSDSQNALNSSAIFVSDRNREEIVGAKDEQTNQT